MGVTSRSMRLWLQGFWPKFNLREVGGLQNRVTLENTNGKRVKVSCYLTAKVRQGGKKATFTVSRLKDADIPWVVFVVQPWGSVYLRKKEEILDNLEPQTREKGAAVITISAGNSNDLFENRIADFLNDETVWEK